ncbi:MAG: site-specific DNA-methyltransferase [Rhizobium sp. 63-7]|nr:MAG: site-specific DNA-methyltransferase [Rhizobium sp. 63-7]
MEPQSVHCCVTSPPYFGLRDYGVDGQLGLEATPDEFVEAMVAVFREVRRVLRDDGTLWLNLGDSYAANRSYQVPSTKGGQKHGPGQSAGGKASVIPDGLKPKDLIGIPWRVAFALQADGWYLRQDIIWHKPNPMPESVRDRCTKAHEYIFMFSKSPRYYFDSDAIKEPAVSDHKSGNGFKRDARKSYQNADGTPRGNDEQWTGVGGLRNRRSVWTVTTKPFKGAHFATFPPDLIEPCILAGCPEGGTVLDPFGGAGTTGLVAQAHGRNAILLELNPEYAAMARERIDAPPVVKRRKPANDNPPPVADLFSARQ